MAAEYIDDGGPAFPTDSDRVDSPFTKAYSGMTLRDYFAAQAIQPILHNVLLLAARTDEVPDAQTLADAAAKGAYGCADAMLKARQS